METLESALKQSAIIREKQRVVYEMYFHIQDKLIHENEIKKAALKLKVWTIYTIQAVRVQVLQEMLLDIRTKNNIF